MAIDAFSSVRNRVAQACARAGRDTAEVEIIAVTKTHGPEVVQEAWQNGLTIVGENKVQEAAWKKPLSVSGPAWHLIGHLQTNKVRHALEIFDFIHSVDSIRLADRLNAVADACGYAPHILLEVNMAGEKSKTGMKPEAVEETLRHLQAECPRLTVEGLMTMAPFSEDPQSARPYFRALRVLRDRLQDVCSIGLPRLSMGMSGDFEVAIEEGATWVRLGTVLFGTRPKVSPMRNALPEEDSALGGLDSYSGAGPTVRILD